MSEGQLKRIPLFPLSNVVLFPGARVPLHIFEPRYRQMLQAALEGDRLLGMVAVRPGHQEQMQGNPPVQPLGCAGFINGVDRWHFEANAESVALTLGPERADGVTELHYTATFPDGEVVVATIHFRPLPAPPRGN